ncbi:hypothetical protein D770_15350 [Flammeovirgaceae bacterium 311]|nr:hypothetical protein D770_15350 [Flammeovirgaceae bacterium 311]
MGTKFFSTRQTAFQQEERTKAACCRLLSFSFDIESKIRATEVPFSERSVKPSSDQLQTITQAVGSFKYSGSVSSSLNNFSSPSRSFLNPGGTPLVPAFTGMEADKLTQLISSMSVKAPFKHWYCKQHARPKLPNDLQVVPRHQRNLLQKLKSETKALCIIVDGCVKPSQMLQAA